MEWRSLRLQTKVSKFYLVNNKSCSSALKVRESGKIWVMEYRILGFGIQNTAQGIRNPTNDWNSKSKFQWQGIRNPVFEIRNPVHGTRKYNCMRRRLKMKKTGRRSKPTSDGINGDRFPSHLRVPKGHALGCHEGMLPPWCFWDFNWPPNFPFLDLWVLLAPCSCNPRQSWILESTLWIPDYRYWILDSLSMETGFRIPITRGIPDSLSRIPYSKALDSRFPMKKISGFRIYTLQGASHSSFEY